MGIADAPARSIARITLIIVGVFISLYLLYRLRTPLTWLFISVFLAVALSRPVNFLNRYMRRGFAILAVYLGMLGMIVALGALLIPPIVTEVNDLADNAPRYAQDVRDYVEKNDRLRKLEEDYDITTKLEQEAEKLPSRVGGAAGTLRDVGFGIVNRIFALVTILVLTAFLLGSGRKWVDDFLALQPPDRAERLGRIVDDVARAVSGYVTGVLAIALIDGTAAFIMLSILGVPFAAPLAVTMGFMSLIPLVGATIGAVIIGFVTVFNDFPGDTIVWTIYAIVYQQVENNLIQPQVQKRTIQLHPFVVLVAVLCGATLLGILGAVVAIPIAASIQIVIRDWWAFRTERREGRQGTAGQQPLPEAGPP